MEKQWGINTESGGLFVDINFFVRNKVKTTSTTGDLIWIHFENSQTISILNKDWKEIQILLRETKINKIINE